MGDRQGSELESYIRPQHTHGKHPPFSRSKTELRSEKRDADEDMTVIALVHLSVR